MQETPWSLFPVSVITTGSFGLAHTALWQLRGKDAMMNQTKRNDQKKCNGWLFLQLLWTTDQKGKKK